MCCRVFRDVLIKILIKMKVTIKVDMKIKDISIYRHVNIFQF